MRFQPRSRPRTAILATLFLLAAAATAVLLTSREPAAGAAGSLTPLQLAGERVIYSYSGLTPPKSLIARIEAGEAAGVILFSDNISSDAQIKQVIAQLQHAAASGPVHSPLLIMTDQEGGEVRRLPGQPVLSERQIGDSSDPGVQATRAGSGAAANLRSVGVNVNLAPVLDVYRQPGNFIDRYGRSYSDRPAVVAALGSDFIRAQQRDGVAATAKHFPGLGAAATSQDTDVQPVTLNVPLAQLRDDDELPYRSAIAAGVRLVMVSWAVYPALDPARPAGLSRTVVEDELRRRLHFTGVTVTDALEAGALRAYGGIPARARLAAGAGMDLLLCADQSVSEGTAAADALAGALDAGQISKAGFMASVRRVLALRQSLAPSKT